MNDVSELKRRTNRSIKVQYFERRSSSFHRRRYLKVEELFCLTGAVEGVGVSSGMESSEWQFVDSHFATLLADWHSYAMRLILSAHIPISFVDRIFERSWSINMSMPLLLAVLVGFSNLRFLYCNLCCKI